jgi:hypothetical protein
MLRSLRKIVPILVSSVLAFALIPMTATSSQAVTVGSFKYSIAGKTATVLGCTSTCPSSLSIPATVPGMSNVAVTAIGVEAFFDDSEPLVFTTVSLPSSLTSIKEAAFRGVTINDTLILPEKLTRVERFAFGSTSIYKIDFNKNISFVGDSAFLSANITMKPSLQMQSGEIRQRAFEGISFDKVTLGANFKSIGIGAFAKKENGESPEITSLTINGGDIGTGAFAETIIGDISLGANIGTIGINSFAGPSSGVILRGKLSVASGIIDEGAFRNSRFAGVTIGKSVVSVGNNAFGSSSEPYPSLGQVSVDARTIQQGAFFGATMSSLTIGTNVAFVASRAFGGFPGSFALGNLAIKGGSFSESAFLGVDATKTTIDASVKRVGSFAFSTSNFGELFVNSSDIGESAFFRSEATSLKFGTNLKSIGEEAFYNFQLTSPNKSISLNPEQIAKNAFSESNITGVTLGSKVRLIETAAFSNTEDLVNVVVDSGQIESAAFIFSGVESLVIGSGVTRIGDFAFFGNDISSLDIANGVTEIGRYAFSGLGELQSIKIPNSISYIGGFAFSNSTSLRNVSFGTGLKHLEDSAFTQNADLTDVSFYGPPPMDSSALPPQEMNLRHTTAHNTAWTAAFRDNPVWSPQLFTRISGLNQPTPLTYTSATNDKPTASKITVKANYSMNATGTVEIKVTQSGSKTVLCSAKVQTRLLSGVAKCDLSKKIRDGLKKKALTLNVALTYSPDLGDVQKPVSKSLTLRKQ